MKVKTFYNLFSLQKRIFAVISIILILFFALFVRIGFIQLVNGKDLQVLAGSQWLRDLPLSAKRGNILDCNGVVLASSKTSFDVYVRARNVDEPYKLATLLSTLLDKDFDAMYKKVTNTGVSESLIKLQVDEDIAMKLVNSNLKGVYLSQDVKRVYPFNSLFEQVLGYCSIDNSGQTGLEMYYNKFLAGVNGKSLIQANAQGKDIDNSLNYYIPSIAGANMHTSLDASIQAILEKRLNEAYISTQAKAVSGLMLDAKTGGIVAMCSLPSFDLNNVPRNDLLELNKLSKNTNIVDVYEPGSIFKIITIAGALNEGLTNVNERFYCSGRCSVDGESIKCWKTQGHGSQTLVEGFKNSCNCVFVNLAMRLGVERLYKYIDLCGIGKLTGIDISSETSGIVMNKDSVKNVDLARIGFGQSVAVSPLQMVVAFARLCSGYSVSPHILEYFEKDGKSLYAEKKSKSKVSLSQDTITTINALLKNNVNEEDKMTFVEGYDVGGKTGTAQKFENGKLSQGKYVSSFVGVYPTKDPKYILLVRVDEPVGAYYGGIVAKPIGQDVFRKMFHVKNILPDDNTYFESVPTVEMPNVIGKSVADASSILKGLGLNINIQGEGDYVVSQLPISGTKLYLGEEVLIITN